MQIETINGLRMASIWRGLTVFTAYGLTTEYAMVKLFYYLKHIEPYNRSYTLEKGIIN